MQMRKRSHIAIHPGKFLVEILTELGITQAEFARAIGVSAMRVSHVVKGTRPMTAELALRFSKALGQSAEYWLNLQTGYDLATARNGVGQNLRKAQYIGHRGGLGKFSVANSPKPSIAAAS
jgi:addiction module HigA family antidote